MFNTAPKAPTRKTSHVLNIFQKTLDDLEGVATQHDQYAEQQRQIAEQASAEANAAAKESAEARDNISSLKKALGR